MSTTTTLFGSAEAQAARALVGGTTLGYNRNDLLKQILVATANRTGGTSGAAWGAITGTLSAQTDLQTALDAKLNKAGGAFTGLTGAGFRDTSAVFDVTLGFTSSVVLDAARALTIDVGNVAHTIALGTTAGTITFPNAAAVTVAGLQIANVFTAAQTITAGLTVSSAPLGISTNGSVSAPALAGTGTIFTGGSATTTKPYWLIEPTGTTSTNWSTSGTLLGINAPSGFTGHLQSWQINGVSYGHINTTGLILGATSLTPLYLLIGSATGTLGFASSTLIEPTANGTLKLSNYARTDFNRLMFGGSTSSFPALKRSTTTLQCRLADDSAYAQFDALGYSVGGAAGVSGTVTAASTVTVVNGIITVIV